MIRKPHPPRRSPVYWTIADPGGMLFYPNVRPNRQWAIDDWLKLYWAEGPEHWPHYQARGYRAVKVRLVPEPAKGGE